MFNKRNSTCLVYTHIKLIKQKRQWMKNLFGLTSAEHNLKTLLPMRHNLRKQTSAPGKQRSLSKADVLYHRATFYVTSAVLLSDQKYCQSPTFSWGLQQNTAHRNSSLVFFHAWMCKPIHTCSYSLFPFLLPSKYLENISTNIRASF